MYLQKISQTLSALVMITVDEFHGVAVRLIMSSIHLGSKISYIHDPISLLKLILHFTGGRNAVQRRQQKLGGRKTGSSPTSAVLWGNVIPDTHLLLFVVSTKQVSVNNYSKV